MKTSYTALSADQVRTISDNLAQNFDSAEKGSLLDSLDALGASGGVAASAAVRGTVLQGAAVADGAVPFASLTTAAEKVNELLASLRAAGVIAP